MTFTLVLAPDAEADIDDILEWSVGRFGPTVRDSYEELIDPAIEDVLADPNPTGSHDRPELEHGICGFHLRSSRDHVGALIYRQVGTTIQVVRILHNAMGLRLHNIE